MTGVETCALPICFPVTISKVKEFVGYLSTDIEKAKELIPNLYKAIDKTAKRGILKKNSAARKKSRLMAKLNQAVAGK